MCGSNKGQSQQQSATNQTSTYAPDPQTIAYLQQALGKASSAAGQGFNVPVAPVAGFSQDQQAAFDAVRGAQGVGNPYIQSAASDFSPTGANAFFNPAVDAVTAQMKNIFGQQQQQNNANLVQSAGGVGADRIAVGQGNLANQQDLAAGQTYANLWNSAVGQSQAAGQGQLATGNQAFNQAFGGANQLLGTGGLQQQETQAQLNAPYQWQVAQAAFPYQQSNFFTNAVASLAPGFGGTTYGTGNSNTVNTPAQPSIWSQLLGAGVAGLGLYNGLGGSSNGIFGSSPTYGGGNMFSGDASGGSSNNPLPGLTVQDYGPGFARGGDVDNPYHFDDGGTANPYGVTSDKPIDIASQSIIPTTQTPHIAPHVPTIDLSPPKMQQQSSSSSGPGLGDIAKTALQIGAMFAKDGGSIPTDDMRRFDGYDPYTFFESRFPKHYGDEGDPGGVVDDNMYRLAGPEAMNAWRKGVVDDVNAGQSEAALPEIITRGTNPYMPKNAMALVDTSKTPGIISKPDTKAKDDDDDVASGPPKGTPYSEQVSEDPNAGYKTAIPEHRDRSTMIDNPWMALAAAGLGIMGGSSPWAGVNIGQGGQQGLKMLETQRENARKDEATDQAWRRLEQEAKHHADQYNRETVAQKNARERAEWQNRVEMSKPIKLGTDKNGYDVMGIRDPNDPRKFNSPFTGEPIDPSIMMPGSGVGAPPPLPTTPGAPGVSAPATPNSEAIRQAQLDGNLWLANTEQAKVPYRYSEDGPPISKGMEVPEPEALPGHSVETIKTNAEQYLQTGKLPVLRGTKGPVAIAQQNFRNAIENYGNALAASRGMTPEEMVNTWRTAPLMGRFILGPDGRATVSLGTAVRHLDTLKAYIDAFNAGDAPMVRRMQAAISREFGGSAATNIDAAASIVGPEIVKAIGVAGAGTEADRTHAMELFKGGTASAKQAVEVVQRLLGGQLEGKERQAAAAGVSKERFKGLIGEDQYKTLRELDKKPIGGGAAERPKPSQSDLDYVKAHPEARDKFIARFGVQP